MGETPGKGRMAARRALTDPASGGMNVDTRNSSDRDHPRVRFSEDVDRTLIPSAATQRPGLSVDTGVGGSNAEQRSPVRLQAPEGQSAISPKSPTSPRTRDRGYSLRRSLFNRSITTHSENSHVESVEAGPSGQRGKRWTRFRRGEGEEIIDRISLTSHREHSRNHANPIRRHECRS